MKIDYIFENFRDNIYSKDTSSNLYRILNSMSKELDNFVTKADQVKDGKFVDTASLKELEKIAEILNIKRYPNESELSFRGRIKSTVPSFVGGGTISSIKQVIRSFLGVDPTIIEHYKPGNGHAELKNGIVHGLKIKDSTGFDFTIIAGVGYLQGQRIYIAEDYTLTVPPSSSKHVILDVNGNFSLVDSPVDLDDSTYINIGGVITTSTGSNGVYFDGSYLVNPFEDAITNVASITVQIPYNFTEGLITVDEAKKILLTTKAAGVALLINVVGAYLDELEITDAIDFSFNVGFSGVGSLNYIGGYE